MKVAITGHTRGIGLSLFSKFDNVIGFSRSNGFDISIESSREEIIRRSYDCDIFINNAEKNFSQTELLFELWEKWKFQQKIIISLGSVAADHIYSAYPHYKYAVQKKSLEDACKYMAHRKYPCKVVCVKPGFVDTPAIENVKNIKIDPDELANFIKVLDNNSTFWIPVVTLYPR